ncbi:hypothetical protein EFP18_28445 [Burkholderia glumae]|nr:hypothetical protein KS03_3707 [Burkholderia glumae LMG 2196 = ATCC 33617]PJO23393.1 hypothetical protein Y5A_009570 [Burkholderia glumae AU6208]PNL05220.1 hypothetical protein CEQ24_004615 [Burkholderia glumae]QGA39731.1 hypothetical protein GAS19_19135 [Burkholderia glumae]QHE13973.1 hypothetical protein GQR88_27830 [Burkholderia glumae AU6208]
MPESEMNKRTMRLVRQLADIRRAQHCTALRAARQAAEADAELARDDDEPDTAGERRDEPDDTPAAGSRIRSPS